MASPTSLLLEGDIDKGIAQKAIKGNSAKFKESGIKPRKLATVLYREELINANAYHKAIDKSTDSDEERLEIILDKIENYTLVKDGYFEELIKCLNNMKDEFGTARSTAEAFTCSYRELANHRESILTGIKKRGSDGLEYTKRKFIQAKEGIKAMAYTVGGVVAKDVPKDVDLEEENDLDEPQEEEDQDETTERDSQEEVDSEATRCLSCGDPIKIEEEPVHEKCLPNYPWCLRCSQNRRSDTETQCIQCLKYQQVSMCYYCLGDTKNLPVHLSCLQHFHSCVRCLEQNRNQPSELCSDCQKNDQALSLTNRDLKGTSTLETECVCAVCGKENAEDSLIHQECLLQYPWCKNCHSKPKQSMSEQLCEVCQLEMDSRHEAETDVLQIPTHSDNGVLEPVQNAEYYSNDLSMIIEHLPVSSERDCEPEDEVFAHNPFSGVTTVAWSDRSQLCSNIIAMLLQQGLGIQEPQYLDGNIEQEEEDKVLALSEHSSTSLALATDPIMNDLDSVDITSDHFKYEGYTLWSFLSALPTISTNNEDFESLQRPYTKELYPLILSWKKSGSITIPEDLFSALIVNLLSHQSTAVQFELKVADQYRNVIQFDCTSHGGSVLLVDAVNSMEIYYTSRSTCSSDRYLCCYVSDVIFQGIKEVVEQLNYDPGLAVPEILFFCLKHAREGLKHKCSLHADDRNKLICSFDNSLVQIDRQYQKPWLQEKKLHIDHLNDVLTELGDLQFSPPKWIELGLGLGLNQNTLDIIKYNYRGDAEECLRESLAKWLRGADMVNQSRGATWIALANALKRIGQGSM